MAPRDLARVGAARPGSGVRARGAGREDGRAARGWKGSGGARIERRAGRDDFAGVWTKARERMSHQKFVHLLVF